MATIFTPPFLLNGFLYFKLLADFKIFKTFLSNTCMAMRVPDRSYPHLDTLDIAITARCNLACKHCYQGYVKNTYELPAQRVVSLFDEGMCVGLEHVVLTGGEPLFHRDAKRIFSEAADRLLFVTLLSNGTLVPELPWVVDCVDEAVISLDGFKEIHEKIRGPGTWDRTVQGIRILVDAGIPVAVNTQITRDTISRLSEYVDFLDELGVQQLNLIPTAAFAYTLENYVRTVDGMSPDDLRKAVDVADFLIGVHAGGSEGDCSALYYELSVNFDGVVYPCHFFRSLNYLSVGNIFYKPIDRIYEHWKDIPLLRRDRKKACNGCPVFDRCLGGCKGRAFAYFGTVNAPDPLHCALLLGKRIEDITKKHMPTVYHEVLGVEG